MARRPASADRPVRRSRRRSASRRLSAEQLEPRRLLSASGGGALLGPMQNVIVVLKDDVADSRSAAVQLIGQPGQSGRIGLTYDHALKGFSAELYSARAMQSSPLVKYVEPDGMMHTSAQVLPNGVDRIDADRNPIANIDAVHDAMDVDIAIIDTGIDTEHPDLNVVGGVRVFRDGGSPFNPKIAYDDNYDDDNGHGTHVAGSAAALDNGFGVVGVAPGSRLWAVKVLDSNGSGSYSEVIAGMDWVTARASDIEVANMSLGGGYSQSVNDALAGMTNAGIVVAVAAGNDGANAGNYSPASAPTAITVSAAVDTDGETGGLGPVSGYGGDDTLASFSNYGSVVDIAAPGVNVYSTVPGGYDTFNGTSMASPHVAGAAALEILARGTRELTGAYVQSIRDALVAAGQPMSEWRSDTLDTASDPDSFNEPMAYVGGEVDQPPTADNLSATTNEDTAIGITLSGSDAETVELTFEIISGPSFGTLSGITNASGTSGAPNTDTASLTYTPNPDYNGSDSFTYRVKDDNGGTAQGAVSLTINAVNDAPVAVADAYIATAGTTLTVDVADGVLANDSDVDGDSLTANLFDASGLSNPTSLILNSDGSFSYTPANGSTGEESFTYTAADPGSLSDTATVTIAVTEPPTAEDLSASVDEDASIALTLKGSDAETVELVFEIVSGPANGSLGAITDQTGVAGSPNTDTAQVTYTPDADYYGSDSFTYRVTDAAGASAEAVVSLTVSPVNDAPVANADVYSTEQDTVLQVPAPGLRSNDTDVDGDALVVNTTAVSGPANGTLALGADGSFTYEPTPGFVGEDTFEYQISDSNGGADTALVTISVDPTITTVHVGDLDGEAVNQGKHWQAWVTITVVDGAGQPVSGAVITGNWTGGYSEIDVQSGQTDSNGQVTVKSGDIRKHTDSTTWTVTGVSSGSLSYDSNANTDPDGDSDGTAITVFKDGTTAAGSQSSAAATDAVLAGSLDDLFLTHR